MKNTTKLKLKLSRILSTLITLIGFFLLIYMIKIEGEPGALPILLIIFGGVWLLINRYQLKKVIQ